MWKTQVRSLGQENALEKEMATHSGILAWRIPWTEESGWLQSMGSQRVGYNRMISVHFQGKTFNITVIQAYAPNSNTEEAEVERFYEDLQDLLELTPQKDVLFIIGDWNAKVVSQGTPGVTGKFGHGVWNEARQRIIDISQVLGLQIIDHFHRRHFCTSFRYIEEEVVNFFNRVAGWRNRGKTAFLCTSTWKE